jgi:hypothetical protein
MRLRIPGLLVVTTALLLALAATGAWAGASSFRESEVKAAFIYNFAKYVEWPADSFPNAKAPLVVTLLGNIPDAAAFESIRGKTVKNRKIELRSAKRVEEVGATHILFVAGSERERLAGIIDHYRGDGILTVSDIDHFDRAGGIISFLTIEEKVRFQINLGAARREGLRISAQLLKLAKNVIE